VAEHVEVCRDAQGKFLKEHLGQWIGALAEALVRSAGGGPYSAVWNNRLCPGQVFGVRMDRLAGDLLSRDLPRTEGCGLRVVEIGGCMWSASSLVLMHPERGGRCGPACTRRSRSTSDGASPPPGHLLEHHRPQHLTLARSSSASVPWCPARSNRRVLRAPFG
jgi:hypothetical protein